MPRSNARPLFRSNLTPEPIIGRASSFSTTTVDLAWNRDPRAIVTRRRAWSVGAQSALGKRPATEDVIRPTLRHLADRVASRLRAKSRSGRTVTVRVRFADLRAVTRSITLPAAISATTALAEIAEELVRAALSDHAHERFISLLAIGVSHLEEDAALQLELPFRATGDERRPGSKKGSARRLADRAVDAIRDRFGREAVGYASVSLGRSGAVPDAFRELAEKRSDRLATAPGVFRATRNLCCSMCRPASSFGRRSLRSDRRRLGLHRADLPAANWCQQDSRS